MILGHLNDTSRQKDVLPAAIVKAIEVVTKLDAINLAPGKYPIEGDDLFYIVEDATPRQVENCHPEAHRTYADIQMPVSTTERFGCALPQANIGVVEENFTTGDIGFYAKPANEFFFDVLPGSYAVFLPGELHRPCVLINEAIPFRKIVVKVHRRLLGL